MRILHYIDTSEVVLKDLLKLFLRICWSCNLEFACSLLFFVCLSPAPSSQHNLIWLEINYSFRSLSVSRFCSLFDFSCFRVKESLIACQTLGTWSCSSFCHDTIPYMYLFGYGFILCRWVDNHLVHILSPNIYRNPSEALESFEYITSNGKIISGTFLAIRLFWYHIYYQMSLLHSCWKFKLGWVWYSILQIDKKLLVFAHLKI